MKSILMAAIAALFFASLANPANAMSNKKNQIQVKIEQSIEFSARRHKHRARHYARRTVAVQRAAVMREGDCLSDNSGRTVCAGPVTVGLPKGTPEQQKNWSSRVAAIDANGNNDSVIGGRPSGCPWAYCGCGLRKYLGIDDVRLNLAANWARLFPHTHARPGAAAVRSHHVMLLVAHVGGSNWTVRDYNGGRHLSYIHERSVSGYVFVDPNAGRLAMR